MATGSLFDLVVPENKLHPSFARMRGAPCSAPARAMMDDAWASFVDQDGNFREQFQTTGFDARVWELYLHAYFTDSGFDSAGVFDRPDFLLEIGAGHRIAVEAVTSNPSGSGPLVEAVKQQAGESEAQYLQRQHQHVLPIKLGSALYSKLQKEYWTLPHMKGFPLVLAVESFHSDDALVFSSGALHTYLYGTNWDWWHDGAGTLQAEAVEIERHFHGKKEIPSGFFSLPGAQHISGVLFSNHGTYAKFNRLGHHGKYRDPRLQMHRIGVAYDPDPNSVRPVEFAYEVGVGQHVEPWGEGITVFSNPAALHPLPDGIFPDALHITVEDGEVMQIPVAFHPFASKTINLFRS